MQQVSTRPTVLLDVDGVIADFRQLYVGCCNEVNSTAFTVEDTGTAWDFARTMGLSREQHKKTWEAINRKGQAGKMTLLPGARAGVLALMSIANVYFVTMPVPSSPTWTYDRNAWLSACFRLNASDHVLYTSQKHLVRGDVFVDDKPEIVLNWLTNNAGLGVIWGKPPELPELKERTFQYDNWNTLYSAVRGVAKAQ